MAAEQRDTVFVMHIMKTAGTTFSHQLQSIFPPEELYPTAPQGPERLSQYWRILELGRLTDEQRSRLWLYQGHFPFMVGDMVGADHTITLLREPIARTISHLHHCARLFPRYEGKSLEEIYDDELHHLSLFVNYQTKQFALGPEDAPRGHTHHLVIDDHRFRRAVQNLEAVSVLGLTESYDAFIDSVSRRFGWDLPPYEPLQVNPGPNDVPDALVQRIERDNAADTELYQLAKKLLGQ